MIQRCLFQRRSGTLKAVQHEVRGTVGMMDITGAVVEVKKLTGLIHSAKQWVVATRAFLDFVKPNGRAFGMPFGGLNRAIEIKREPRQALALKRFDDNAAGLAPDVFDAPCSHLRKGS